MQYLPTVEEQDWLVGELAGLIRKHGFAPFVAAPIVQPSATFFPEDHGEAAFVLDRATRRLLQYAGLGDLEVSFDIFVEVKEAENGSDPHRDSTAAYFRGIEAGCCHFGLDTQGPADAEYLAGVMCHEVAHAYRSRHGLVTSGESEELLTDMSTVYLGFGILAANNAWRFRSSGEVRGSIVVTKWSVSRAGYLPPQALAFLLALQMSVRELDRDQRQEILRHLEPNQADFLARALAHTDLRHEEMRNRLGIPPAGEWPAEKATAAILQPLPAFVPWVEVPATEVRWNNGEPVFRMGRSRAGSFGVLGTLVAGAAAIALSVRTGTWLPGMILTLGGISGGVFLGRRRSRDICSDSDCHVVLPAASDKCPGCGRAIMGRIRDRDEIVDALERLQAQGLWSPESVFECEDETQ